MPGRHLEIAHEHRADLHVGERVAAEALDGGGQLSRQRVTVDGRSCAARRSSISSTSPRNSASPRQKASSSRITLARSSLSSSPTIPRSRR